MKNILEYIIEHIVDHPEDSTIDEEREEGIVRFNVSIHESDYPRIIGKGGLTIKAITDIMRTSVMRTQAEEARIYVNVQPH